MNKDFVLNTKKNEKIRISCYGYENIQSAPCLVCVHGFKGFKDWGFWPYTGNFFAEKGYFVLTFNFSHNGVGDSLTEFTELNKFADNTFSLELEELDEIIEAYFDNYFGNVKNYKLGILGHSRGGGEVLLFASRKKQIEAVVTWAAVAEFNRYSKRQEKEWRKRGFFEVLNTRTNQLMRLNVTLLEDIEKNRENILNIEKAVSNLNKPLLIIHGEQDLSVPIKEAEQIYQYSNKNLTEFFRVPATGHTFDVTHPFVESNPKFDSVLEKTLDFFNQHLN
jgi:dienelactone hydrolase